MATTNKPRTALGVEMTGDEVRLALVENRDGAIRVLASETLRASDDLGRAVRGLPKRPAAVTCAISLENAAVRVLSLPPTTEENLERVIALEAEGVLPLEADDLALSHHILGMTEQSRLEVLVGAGRLATVQETLGRLTYTPWVSASVTVSSIALENALHQLHPPTRDGVAAILRVEERETELLVLERYRVLLARTLPVGAGAEVVPAPQPVAVGAEQGVQVPGLDTPEPSWVAALSQQVRYALQALSYERGLTIERLYLCGGGASRSGLDWRLSERLDLPITTLAPAGGEAPEGMRYAVAYGCALQGAGAAGIALNLTPARVVVAREIEQRRQSQVSWGALAAAVGVAAALVFGAAVHNRQQALAQLDRRLQELGVVVAQPVMEPAALKSAAGDIAEAAEARVQASRAISALSRSLPTGTWLAEMTYNSQTGCAVTGYTTHQNGAQSAQIALLNQRLFDEVTLDYRTEERLNNVPVWAFRLSCKLRPKEPTGGRTGLRGRLRR